MPQALARQRPRVHRQTCPIKTNKDHSRLAECQQQRRVFN